MTMFMLFRFLVLLFLFVPSIGFAKCAKPDEVKKLLDRYGETLVGDGLNDNQKGIIRLYLNEETQSFTIVEVLITGGWCIRLHGNQWIQHDLIRPWESEL